MFYQPVISISIFVFFDETFTETFKNDACYIMKLSKVKVSGPSLVVIEKFNLSCYLECTMIHKLRHFVIEKWASIPVFHVPGMLSLIQTTQN